MMAFRFLSILLLFCLIFSSLSLVAQDKACQKYRRYPLAGHPVAITKLHQTDKNIQRLEELKHLKMILLEPGVCEIDISGTIWLRGRVFVMKSFSSFFKHGNIITIEAGQFR